MSGSFVKSSQANEYRVSAFGLTTLVNVASGNSVEMLNRLIGAAVVIGIVTAVITCRLTSMSTSGKP